jgi:hypothetical protein
MNRAFPEGFRTCQTVAILYGDFGHFKTALCSPVAAEQLIATVPEAADRNGENS